MAEPTHALDQNATIGPGGLTQTGPLARVVREVVELPAPSVVARFLAMVEVRPGRCWPWRGAVEEDSGYGSFHGPRTRRAHRAAFLLLVGPVPPGFHVDHRCHNLDATCPGGLTCPHRRCVNPDHLAAVPATSNVRSGRHDWSRCDRVHPETATRLREQRSGRVVCDECRRVDEQNRRSRRVPQESHGALVDHAQTAHAERSTQVSASLASCPRSDSNR